MHPHSPAASLSTETTQTRECFSTVEMRMFQCWSISYGNTELVFSLRRSPSGCRRSSQLRGREVKPSAAKGGRCCVPGTLAGRAAGGRRRPGRESSEMGSARFRPAACLASGLSKPVRTAPQRARGPPVGAVVPACRHGAGAMSGSRRRRCFDGLATRRMEVSAAADAGYGSACGASSADGRMPCARPRCTASSLLRAPSFAKMPRTRVRTPS